LFLEIQAVSKTFGKTKAVRNVSLSIPEGQISGFLGPNGAGKTTLIRMIMDIIKPDQGAITLHGSLSGSTKNHIGYLPEERGLYTKAKVRETLTYFAELKGLTPRDAEANTSHFLSLLNMSDTAKTPIGKLSKGNQQKIQLISAMVSRPELLILDEPFSGLDPLNAKLVADLITRLREEGTTIVLSTHQMNQAEAFCQNIFLFNRGELILDGALEPIIQRHSGGLVLVETPETLPDSPLFRVCGREHHTTRIQLEDGVTTRELMAWLSDQPFETRSLKPYRVPLGDIFISEVKAHA
jgi:ABC-2 type transport system ATP-binding protein